MDKIIERIGKAVTKALKEKPDIELELIQILKDIALTLESHEKRLKTIEQRPYHELPPCM